MCWRTGKCELLPNFQLKASFSKKKRQNSKRTCVVNKNSLSIGWLKKPSLLDVKHKFLSQLNYFDLLLRNLNYFSFPISWLKGNRITRSSAKKRYLVRLIFCFFVCLLCLFFPSCALLLFDFIPLTQTIQTTIEDFKEKGRGVFYFWHIFTGEVEWKKPSKNVVSQTRRLATWLHCSIMNCAAWQESRI